MGLEIANTLFGLSRVGGVFIVVIAGTTIAIGMVVGVGIAPALLGAVADALSFQVGILGLGVLTVLSCFILRGISRRSSQVTLYPPISIVWN